MPPALLSQINNNSIEMSSSDAMKKSDGELLNSQINQSESQKTTENGDKNKNKNSGESQGTCYW